jgi:hypothetical protein
MKFSYAAGDINCEYLRTVLEISRIMDLAYRSGVYGFAVDVGNFW